MSIASAPLKIKSPASTPGMPSGLTLYESGPTTARCDWCGADVEFTTGAILRHGRTRHYVKRATVFVVADAGGDGRPALIIRMNVRP